nr:YchJ family protein [uncultured Flavobacterium sp.]
MTSKKCYCGTSKAFKECCEIYINGIQKAPTAEALMRSRYAAYASHNADYLVATTHVSQRKHHSKKDILDWATANNWLRLEILKTTENTVEFKAYYLNKEQQQSYIHHEKSTFIFENESWFYVDGTFH